MTRRFFPAIALCAALAAYPAFALDLASARAQGVLGEKSDGYVAVLAPAPGVQQLASDINAKRKAEYQRIAAEKGQTAAVVAKLAAQQIAGQVPPGTMVQDAGGAWKKR